METKKIRHQLTSVLRRLLYVTASLALVLAIACKDDEPEVTYPVKIKLDYPEGYTAAEGVKVKLENRTTRLSFDGITNSEGIAEFTVIAGEYTVTVSDIRSVSGNRVIFNASQSGIIITGATLEPLIVGLVKSKTGQIVIKEYYFNGCQNNDGNDKFQRDPYVILYNNSDEPASLENLCFGATIVANSQAANNDYVGGKLFYENEGWVPAGFGIFYFGSSISLEPGKQVVVAINSANDHTVTYNNSVNLANADYYVFYDINSGFNSATYHPAPSNLIPASHYLKAIRYPSVTSNAYTMSVMSPAFFIFSTEGTTPAAFAADTLNNINKYNNSNVQARLKVPVEWVIDGVEVFQKGAAVNYKRLPAAVDVGSIDFPDVKQGYTLYRNVDKDATESIAGNAGKLVYNYTGVAPDFVSDPSSIDAEASIRNGARIIYKDTNNAGVDFHVRGKASLRN